MKRSSRIVLPATIACTVLLMGAYTWGRPALSAPGRHVEVAARPVTKLSNDRVYLDSNQVRSGLADGAIDRPVLSLLKVDHPLQFGEVIWNDQNVPDGEPWIRVDLGKQLISAFRGGHEVGTALIVYGGDNKETPTGTLHVLAKLRDHRSSLYDAEMPYTLRLTNDGVSIHASNVRPQAATHGCIGVPLEFARKLFATMKVGDDVVVVPAARPA